ncbi:hypothetical protein M5689_019012 [Euphorbia peplus]|nr:hypothetical protein M5689_019012 [Euphorbia peplus]
MDLLESIKVCASAPVKWNRDEFGHVGNQIRVKREKIVDLQSNLMFEPLYGRIKAESGKVAELLVREEMWKQHSRVDWLRGRDANTKFFHAKASSWHRPTLY